MTFQEYQQAAADYAPNCKIPILTFIIWVIASTATCCKGLRDLGQQCVFVMQYGFSIALNIWIKLSLFLSDQISVIVKHCLPASVNTSSALRNNVQSLTYSSDFIKHKPITFKSDIVLTVVRIIQTFELLRKGPPPTEQTPENYTVDILYTYSYQII